MTETGTALAERSVTETVLEGARLDPEDWGGARIAAARKLLPAAYQDPASLIAFLAIAQRTGLDPFIKEMWAWEQKGQLQFMTARDGWIRLAADDPSIEGVEFGHVYANDTFEFSTEGGKVHIIHSGTMDRGELVGAYCCAHRSGEADDHLERRLVADYAHLFGKDNWKQYPQDMLLTRVVSACIKMVCKKGASLYSEADFMFEEQGLSGAVMEQATGVRAEALRARLQDGREIAVPEGAETGNGAHAATEAPSSGEERQEEPTSEPIAAEPRFPCPQPDCPRTFTSERGRSLHITAHRRQAALKKEMEKHEALEVQIVGLPAEYFCLEGGVLDEFDLWAPDGTVIGSFASHEAALEAALSHQNSVERDEALARTTALDAVVERPAEQEAPPTARKVHGISGIEFYRFVDEHHIQPERIRAALDDPANEFAAFAKADGVKVAIFDLDNEARWRLMEILETLGS